MTILKIDGVDVTEEMIKEALKYFWLDVGVPLPEEWDVKKITIDKSHVN